MGGAGQGLREKHPGLWRGNVCVNTSIAGYAIICTCPLLCTSVNAGMHPLACHHPHLPCTHLPVTMPASLVTTSLSPPPL